MRIGLTIKDERGTLCEREPYTLEELMEHEGFSKDEKRCFVAISPWLAVEWKRGNVTMRLEPLAN